MLNDARDAVANAVVDDVVIEPIALACGSSYGSSAAADAVNVGALVNVASDVVVVDDVFVVAALATTADCGSS